MSTSIHYYLHDLFTVDFEGLLVALEETQDTIAEVKSEVENATRLYNNMEDMIRGERTGWWGSLTIASLMSQQRALVRERDENLSKLAGLIALQTEIELEINERLMNKDLVEVWPRAAGYYDTNNVVDLVSVRRTIRLLQWQEHRTPLEIEEDLNWICVIQELLLTAKSGKKVKRIINSLGRLKASILK